jgi:hypothetical protein
MNATAVMIRRPAQAAISDRADAGERAPQHLRALQRANQIRLARADIKRRVALGDVSAVEVLLSGAEEIETMEISELLTSQRRWGHTRARRFLAAIPMTESKTIGSMTERQVATLASMLSACMPQGTVARSLSDQPEHATA